MDYKSFPVQNIINSGNIQNSLNRILEMQKASEIGFVEPSTVTTPPHIVDDMLDMIPETIWNHKTRFLNLACKDGIFLIKIFQRLFNSNDLERFEPKERAWHILENQLFAVCIDQPIANMLSTLLYGMSGLSSAHITWLGSIKDLKSLSGLAMKQYVYQRFISTGQIDKKETSQYMNFDVVIGNPPYNSDIYLDFVTLGKELIKENNGTVCMITPAKWQSKGGKNNEAFRQHIVPYISKIKYYPDAKDIFEIKIQGGVAYYIFDNNVHDSVNVTNKCKKNNNLNSENRRKLSISPILLNAGIEILNKVKEKPLNNVRCNTTDKFGVYIINAYMNGAIMLNTGNTLLLGDMHIENNSIPIVGNSDIMIFSSDNKEVCDSFVSYMNTKFVRFIAFLLIDGQQPKFNTIWKFVPDPGNFDHIFTDTELYEKYRLTDIEIGIIESVIKERK